MAGVAVSYVRDCYSWSREGQLLEDPSVISIERVAPSALKFVVGGQVRRLIASESLLDDTRFESAVLKICSQFKCCPNTPQVVEEFFTAVENSVVSILLDRLTEASQ